MTDDDTCYYMFHRDGPKPDKPPAGKWSTELPPADGLLGRQMVWRCVASGSRCSEPVRVNIRPHSNSHYPGGGNITIDPPVPHL